MAKKEVDMSQLWEMLKNLDTKMSSVEAEIKDSCKTLDSKIEIVSKELSESTSRLAKHVDLRIKESHKELSERIDTLVNTKFAIHTQEVKITLDDFTKQINTHLIRQDENLEKAKRELNEQIEKRANEVQLEVNKITGEMIDNIKYCSERVLTQGEDIKALNARVGKVEQKD